MLWSLVDVVLDQYVVLSVDYNVFCSPNSIRFTYKLANAI